MLVVALLFLCGAMYNFLSASGDAVEGWAGLGIAVVLGITELFLRLQAARSEEFLTWLDENADEVERAGAIYEGCLITAQDEVTRFQGALSFLLISVKASSRYYLRPHESVLAPAAVYTVISLLMGWWALPFGPIYVVQCVFGNLMGGQRRAVYDLLADLRAPDPPREEAK